MERSCEISEAFISERVSQLSQLSKKDHKNFIFPDNTVKVFTSVRDEKVYGIIHVIVPNAFYYFESLYNEDFSKYKLEFRFEIKTINDLKNIWKERWDMELTNL